MPAMIIGWSLYTYIILQSNKKRLGSLDIRSDYLHNSEEDLKAEDPKLWSQDEVLILIRLWDEFNQSKSKINLMPSFYKEISTRLQQEIHKDIPYTEKEIYNKINSLRRQYR